MSLWFPFADDLVQQEIQEVWMKTEGGNVYLTIDRDAGKAGTVLMDYSNYLRGGLCNEPLWSAAHKS